MHLITQLGHFGVQGTAGFHHQLSAGHLAVAASGAKDGQCMGGFQMPLKAPADSHQSGLGIGQNSPLFGNHHFVTLKAPLDGAFDDELSFTRNISLNGQAMVDDGKNF